MKTGTKKGKEEKRNKTAPKIATKIIKVVLYPIFKHVFVVKVEDKREKYNTLMVKVEDENGNRKNFFKNNSLIPDTKTISN